MTQATLDQWRGKMFRLGHADCVRLTASHLRRMGHAVRLPAKGRYGSLRSAMKELSARGFADVLTAMDAHGFARIAPAAALPGDVVAVPSDQPTGCLMVQLSNGRALGFLEEVASAEVLQPVDYVAAWRVPPA